MAFQVTQMTFQVTQLAFQVTQLAFQVTPLWKRANGDWLKSSSTLLGRSVQKHSASASASVLLLLQKCQWYWRRNKISSNTNIWKSVQSYDTLFYKFIHGKDEYFAWNLQHSAALDKFHCQRTSHKICSCTTKI